MTNIGGGSGEYSRELLTSNTRSEWSLTLDADEDLTQEFLDLLPDLIKRNIDGYYLKIDHYIEEIFKSTEMKYRLYKRNCVSHVNTLHGGCSPLDIARVERLEDFTSIVEYKSQLEYESDHHRYISMTRDSAVNIGQDIKTQYGVK